ncbi:MAG: hypothetical protein AABO41_10540 [Acidobacteriota bacterium]
MRTNRSSPIIALLLATLVFTSCKGTSSGTSAAPGTTPSNANAPTPQPAPNQADAASSQGPVAPPQLAGTYVMSEVQEKGGVLNIISENKTVIHFDADGSYSRASSNKGRLYHTDSGDYRIEGSDKLVLTIRMSKGGSENKIHNPPLQKPHQFTLSSNGEELRMTSSDGNVALFRRIARVQK